MNPIRLNLKMIPSCAMRQIKYRQILINVISACISNQTRGL